MIPMRMTGKKIKEFFSELRCSSEEKFAKESLSMNEKRGLIQITLDDDQKEKLRVKKISRFLDLKNDSNYLFK